MGIPAAITAFLTFIMKIWDWFKGYPKLKLENRRLVLQEESRQAQLIGDLDALRKARAEINDIDNRLDTGDY